MPKDKKYFYPPHIRHNIVTIVRLVPVEHGGVLVLGSVDVGDAKDDDRTIINWFCRATGVDSELLQVIRLPTYSMPSGEMPGNAVARLMQGIKRREPLTREEADRLYQFAEIALKKIPTTRGMIVGVDPAEVGSDKTVYAFSQGSDDE